jgi:hypothetical protein
VHSEILDAAAVTDGRDENRPANNGNYRSNRSASTHKLRVRFIRLFFPSRREFAREKKKNKQTSTRTKDTREKKEHNNVEPQR